MRRFVQFHHFVIELEIDVVLVSPRSGDRNRAFMMREIRSCKVDQDSNQLRTPVFSTSGSVGVHGSCPQNLWFS